MISPLLPPANEVWGKVIFLHLSVILFTGGVVSQHALQVSRPTPKGEVKGDLAGGGVSRLTTKGEVEGDLVQAYTQGEVEGDLVQAHTQGGS